MVENLLPYFYSRAQKQGIEFEGWKVDEVVEKLKKGPNSKLSEELFSRTSGLMLKAVNEFCSRYKSFLFKQGIKKETVEKEAIRIVLEKVGKWDAKKRMAEGKTYASFNSFVFGDRLVADLRDYFVRRGKRLKRRENNVALDAFDESEQKDSFLAETGNRTEAEQLDVLIKKTDKILLLNALRDLAVEKPLMGIILILKFGLGNEYLADIKKVIKANIKEKHDVGFLHGGTADKLLKFIYSRKKFEYEDEQTLNAVGELFGVSRQDIEQQRNEAFKILKEKLKEYDDQHEQG